MKQYEEIDLTYYWKTIWEHKIFIITFVLIISIIFAGISLILPKWYRATSVILTNSPEKSGLLSLGSKVSAFGFGNMLGGDEVQMRILSILKSRRILEALNNKFHLDNKYKTTCKEDTYKAIRSHYKIDVGEENQIFISFEDRNQNLVAEMTNYIIHTADSLNILLSTNNAKNNKIFLENRINIVKDSLSIFENQIVDFMKKNNILDISDQISTAVLQAADLKAKITANEIELKLKENYLSGDSPEIKMLREKIEMLKLEFEKLFTGLEEDKLFIGFDNISKLQIEYIRLKRKEKYYEKLLEYLGPQYEEAKFREAMDLPTFQILDKAERPEKRYKPKRAFIVILSAFVSFPIAIIIVFILGAAKRKK